MRQIANKAQNWYDNALLPVDAMLAGGGEGSVWKTSEETTV